MQKAVDERHAGHVGPMPVAALGPQDREWVDRHLVSMCWLDVVWGSVRAATANGSQAIEPVVDRIHKARANGLSRTTNGLPRAIRR
jgi:hypothetical protein